jgi:Tol biopolymer transport system component/C-terminal processing protease CtpA/Prc
VTIDPSRARRASRTSTLSRAALIALLAGAAPALAQPAAGGANAPAAQAEPSAAMLRWPDVSPTHICFVYANDVWIVPRGGGAAVPLSSPAGQEQFPRFSPDGKTIAFNANYDGNREIYTMPTTGGVPSRVTHHPAGETVCDWTPDGSGIVFLSNGLAGLARQSQLFQVSAKGGLPEQLPVPYAGFGSISPDGTWLAYTPHSTDTRTWKRYRGGMATDVWLFNLKTKASKRISDWEGTDTLPMWAPNDNGKVYFLSDRGADHRLNVWVYDVAKDAPRQITKFTEDDVRWPSMGPGPKGGGEIIFQLGPSLVLLDLFSELTTEINVTLAGDRPTVRPRAVDASRNLTAASISPSGKRVIVEARGDLWSLPAKEGVVRGLTRTDGIAERDPSWSPDGRWIAYFSDETGEYELYVRPSDAKPADEKAEGDEKKEGDAKDSDKKDSEKADAEKKEGDKKEGVAAKKEPQPEPRKLTNLGAGYRYNPTWSPDSKWILFTDKANGMFLTSVESGETKTVDVDPWDVFGQVSWSHDSGWIAYAKSEKDLPSTAIWVYNVKAGEKSRLTSSMFPCGSPAFDRKGEYLYYTSTRNISGPRYSDVDGTYIYDDSEQLLMVPLRKDVKSPWLPESDEEQIKKDDKKGDAKKDEAKKDEKKDEAGKGDGKKDEEKKEPEAKADDGVSGRWDGRATGNAEGMPPEGLPIQLTLKVSSDGAVTGTIASALGGGPVTGTYDKAAATISLSFSMGDATVSLTGTLKDGRIEGKWNAGDETGAWNANRRAPEGNGEKKDDAKKSDAKDDKKDEKKEVKIDIEGFEGRSMLLPIPGGSFGRLAVSSDNKLLYVRRSSRGGARGGASIQIFDPKDDAKEEKLVTAGAGGFDISADGKKLLVNKGGWQVLDASAGGGKATTVPTSGMTKVLDPRTEWKQIFNEAWRLDRDFFYEPTMHGVDWPAMREHYGKMLDDCISREDVNWVISEMISELNIGHAYLGNPGDVENSRTVGVGLLGCDYELVTGDGGAAYRISKIYQGAPWDADARGPLSQPGVDVKVGEFLLAVNGQPVDTAEDPWAAFIGTNDKQTSITVGPKPKMDGSERTVIVTPLSSEVTVRYRAWIENNRATVEKKSGGKIGYIYVPNTGQDGQSDLYRQFFGQRDRAALIIDERWNGGGQIPNRFIELLNRPVINYWARRDGHDWMWPLDGHNGPKAMLINGLAGSGGDAFPWYFKHLGIGKVIGNRTWGGLVGISGNPQFVDGGSITVPTFGFYETDGTWGVEGHGVDPDMPVIDDPALMQNGGDPQLDAAISHLLEELKTKTYVAPKRPASPNRKGMGIPPQDR